MISEEIIGKKISEARKNKNMTQRDLSRLLFTSPQAVSKWERGESLPNFITFNYLALALEVDLNYFQVLSIKSDDIKLDESSSLNENKPEDILKSQDISINMGASVWKNADFSGLKNIGNKFSSSNIKNCKFKDADFSSTILKANNVSLTEFSNSNFSNSKLIASLYENCHFDLACFKYTELVSSYFIKCDFTSSTFDDCLIKTSLFSDNIIGEVNWFKTRFISNRFKKMEFSGEITECSFINNIYNNLKFTNSTLKNCFFKGGNIKRIIFENCYVDKLTYAFLKNAKVNLDLVTII
ncbi:MAG: pentapeptide repeat-containing protein [Acholeplasmatales bacterium]|jgi:transcriptional regulator with XRE-family HTH domain|nr:pentapeptide repeat-containing protein [Acholeplasmatales bacterium]